MIDCTDTGRSGHFPDQPMAPCPRCGSCSYTVGAGADRCVGCTLEAHEADRPRLHPDPDGCTGAIIALVLATLLFWGPLLYWLLVRHG